MEKTYNISAKLMEKLISILNNNWFTVNDRNNDQIIEITHELEILKKEQDEKIESKEI